AVRASSTRNVLASRGERLIRAPAAAEAVKKTCCRAIKARCLSSRHGKRLATLPSIVARRQGYHFPSRAPIHAWNWVTRTAIRAYKSATLTRRSKPEQDPKMHR